MEPKKLQSLLKSVCLYGYNNNDWSTFLCLVDSLPSTLNYSFTEDSDIYTGWENFIFALNYLNKRIPQADQQIPRYDSIASAIFKFNTRGTRQKARKELQTRLPYVAYNEQVKILYAFLNASKTDRTFAYKYLQEHWEERFEETIINLYEKHRDVEAAWLITKRCSIEYIKSHENDLLSMVSYLSIRLRYPESEPINADRLTDNDLLYLFAKQRIDLENISQYKNLTQIITNIILNSYKENIYTKKQPEIKSILTLKEIRRMNWCLAKLKQTEMIFRVLEVDKCTREFIAKDDYEGVKNTILSIIY